VHATISIVYLFLSERFNFLVVFREFFLEGDDLLLEVVFGAFTPVLESILVHLKDGVEAVRPVKHGAVQFDVFN